MGITDLSLNLRQ